MSSTPTSTHSEGAAGPSRNLRRRLTVEELIQQTDTEDDEKVLVLRKAVFLEELSKSSHDLLSDNPPAHRSPTPSGAKEASADQDEKQDAENDQDEAKAGSILSTPEKILCPCGKALAVPPEIEVFQCPFCELILQRPRRSAEEESLFSLHKWVIREAVSEELTSWMCGDVDFEENDSTLWGRLYSKFQSFPFFANNLEEVNKAMLAVFKLVPEIERHMMNSNRKGIRKRMVNLVAGPIVYATFADVSKRCSGLHQEYNDSIILFMNSLTSRDAISRTLEWVSSCHSTTEMPPLMRRMFDLQLKAGTASLQHTLAKKSSRSKFQTLYRIFPSTVFLGMLKAGITIKPGSGLTTKLLLAKPLGGLSLLQRMVYEVLSVDKFKRKAKEAARQLPTDVQKRCFAYTELESVDLETAEQLSDEEVASRILSHKQRSTEEIKQLAPLVRNYVQLQLELQELRALVEITGDERVENLYRVIVPTLQRSMFVDVTAKGSGYIRLMEVILREWKHIMQAHQNRQFSEDQKAACYADSLKKIQDALFSLFHNVFRIDRSGNWHKLAFWLVNNWNASRLDIDIKALLDTLSSEEQALALDDAKKLLEHDRKNILRAKGAEKAKRPEIEHCDALVKEVATTLVTQALPLEEKIRQSELFLDESDEPTICSPHLARQSGKASVVQYIEIVADYEDVSTLKRSGYTKVKTSLNEGMSGTGTWLWFKKVDASTLAADYVLPPITEIRVVFDNEDEESLKTEGYLKIWKKLNIKGSGDIYLWYRRGGPDAPLEDIVALPGVKTQEAVGESPGTRLQRLGYAPLEKSIFRKKKTNAFEAKGFWEKNRSTVQLWVKRAKNRTAEPIPHNIPNDF